MDELYEDVIVGGVLMKWLFGWFQTMDSRGVDGVVNGVAQGIGVGGRVVRRMQTGQLQLYGLVIGIGLVAIILALYFWG
ncbi:MAG: NADH-quinone oxidoreductase subunit L, partial [Chloroflexota bacterium]